MSRKCFSNLLLLALLGAGGVLCSLLFEYSQKTEEKVAGILGITYVDIVSFDYVDNGNLIESDAIELYKLSNTTIFEFLNNSSLMISDEFYESYSNWKKINWSKTPINLFEWDEIYTIAFKSLRPQSIHNDWNLKIQELLNGKNAFYSLYYKADMSSFSLFLLDVDGRNLYCVYFSL